MGYYLKAFIGRLGDLEVINRKFKNAKIALLVDQIALLPMTEELFDEINNYQKSDDVAKYVFLTINVEKEILKIIDDRMISYIEAEYCGGIGGQIGIIWKDGKRIFDSDFEQEVINRILRRFGVICSKSKDEFDTVGLGRYRHTEDWVEVSE